MALTLANMVAAVNLELQNHTRRGSAQYTGDGSAASFYVAPLGSYIVDDDTWEVFLDDVVQSSGFTMDFNSGVCEFSTPPTDGAVISWQFNYVYWPEDVVEQAVEAGATMCYPYFYRIASQQEATDGETYVFDIDDGEVVTKVYYKGSSDESWKRLNRDRYEFSESEDGKYIRFYSAPATGTIDIYTVARPTVYGDYAIIDSRAEYPIISYACYYLLQQKVAPRVRADVAIVTQGSGNVYPKQMIDAANAFYMRFQFQLQSMRMQPWSIH